jgi:hypothetical protein
VGIVVPGGVKGPPQQRHASQSAGGNVLAILSLGCSVISIAAII